MLKGYSSSMKTVECMFVTWRLRETHARWMLLLKKKKANDLF